MAVKIQYRRGTAAEWVAANTVLAQGEPGYEYDTQRFKVGDGSTPWTVLPYASGVPAGITILPTLTGAPNSAPTVVNTLTQGLSNANLQFTLPRAYTVTLGTVNDLQPNFDPYVINVGNTTDIVLNIGLPRAYTVTTNAGSVVSPNVNPTVTNAGNTTDLILSFNLPRQYTVAIGNTDQLAPNARPRVVNSANANSTDLVLNIGLPRAYTITFGNVDVFAPNALPRIVNAANANSTDLVLNIGIPRAYTLTLGVVNTLIPNGTPYIINVGNTTDQVWNIGIPRAPSIDINTTPVVVLAPNQNPTVTDVGNVTDPRIVFGLPRAYGLALGTVNTLLPNASPYVVNVGNTTDAIWNIGIPRAADVALNTIPTVVLAPNQNPAVTDVGNVTDPRLVFSLPRAYGLALGTTTTVTPGNPATVTNAGNTTDLLLNFAVPRGNTGDKGGLKWSFSNSTLNANPGLGLVAFDNSNVFTSVTRVFMNLISELGTNYSSWMDFWDDSTTPNNKGQLVYISNIDGNNVTGVFRIDGIANTSPSGYKTILVTPRGGVMPNNSMELAWQFSRTGDKGDTGPMTPKTVSIAYPSGSENVTIMWLTQTQSLSKITHLVLPTAGATGPQARFSVRYGTNRTTGGTEVVTGGILANNFTIGANTTTFNNPTLGPNNWVWLTTSSATTNTAELHVTLEFV